MSSGNPKRQMFAQFAVVARALGHEHRLELIEHLGQGEWPVEHLSARTGLAFANVSQHLQQLRRGGLVTSRRSGKQILYSLASGPIVELIAAVQQVAGHNLAEAYHLMETYYRKLDALEAIASAELMARLRDDTVTLLDVRPDDEFRAGHLPGALQVDLAELELRLGELPTDREIVAYCRGPYCVLSFEAVSLLRAHGLPARRLVDGFPEWKAAGLPVEKAA